MDHDRSLTGVPFRVYKRLDRNRKFDGHQTERGGRHPLHMDEGFGLTPTKNIGKGTRTPIPA